MHTRLLQAEEQQKIYAAEVALLHHAAVHATQETAQRESELKDARRSRQRLARELAKARARVEQLEAEAAQHEQLQRDSLQAQLKNLDEREVAVRAEKVAVLVLAEAEAQNMQLQEKLDTKTRKLVESVRSFPFPLTSGPLEALLLSSCICKLSDASVHKCNLHGACFAEHQVE